MKAAKTTKFDAAEYLDGPEEIAAFLTDAVETGTYEEFVHALGIAARAKGMSAVAKAAGVGRESLYKSLSDGAKPEFQTVAKILHALGVTMSFQAAA
ncbi:MAG: putative addiction module antidote protein [Pseudomonadota bacterium]|nr:putative addiction module antidote protein [Pseudomonadota bacterium]